VSQLGLRFIGIGVLLLSLCGAGSALAQGESCVQCKYLRCLKNTVARKQSLIKVYEGLQKFWEPRHLDDSGRPLMVRNLGALAEPQRSRIYRATMEQLDEFRKMEESRTGAVPAADGCGYPEGAEQFVSTDSFELCTTQGLKQVLPLQPCRELAQLIEAHEARHAKACGERKQGAYWRYVVQGADPKFFPPMILTPAGKAAEEIAAYQFEIEKLNGFIAQLEKNCPRRAYTSRIRRPGIQNAQPRWNNL